MSAKTVLITGGLSKISNAIAENLVFSKGHKVVILNSYPENGFNRILAKLKNHKNVTLLNVSNTYEEGLQKVLKDYQISDVIDCSLHASSSLQDPLKSAQKLLVGITTLLDAIRTSSSPPSLTLLSSHQVYGNSENRVETQPLEPTTFAGADQMSVEAMVHSYAVSYRIPTVIARLGDLASDVQIGDEFLNILSLEQAAEGCAKLMELERKDLEPAEVFNVSNSKEVKGAETRKARQSPEKIEKLTGWKAGESSAEEQNKRYVPLKPFFLIYGTQSLELEEFVKLLKWNYVSFKTSSVDLQKTGDAAIKSELLELLPSHIIYISSPSTQDPEFEGDCFTLRSNVSRNLYVPWLLASEADKAGIHFTHIGRAVMEDPTTSASAVKIYAEKMLPRFENILQFRLAPLATSARSELYDDQNVILQVLRLPEDQVEDQETSITVLDDCLSNILSAIENSKVGIFDAVNPGFINLKEIREIAIDLANGTDANVESSAKIECAKLDGKGFVTSSLENLKLDERILHCAASLI